MKTYHFMAGLPRSGSTVLTAILNQHPDIYVSPISPLSSLMWANQVEAQGNDNIRRSPKQHERYERIQSFMADVMYSDVEKPVIVDREKDWGHPENIKLATRYITPKMKIVTTVRSIPDILASYIAINSEAMFNEAENTFQFATLYKDRTDAIIEHIMRPNGPVERSLFSIHNSLNDENCSVHLVEYENLLMNPEETLKGIEDFLEVDSCKYDLNNIQKVDLDLDMLTGHSENLHHVRPVLSRSDVSAMNILPARIVTKYSGMEFWRK